MIWVLGYVVAFAVVAAGIVSAQSFDRAAWDRIRWDRTVVTVLLAASLVCGPFVLMPGFYWLWLRPRLGRAA